VDVTAVNAAGNHVIVDMGFGRYAMYARMAPHTVAVKLGQFVRQGTRLGAVGNTGSSTGPHLHFQVMDRPSPLAAYGLPFVFDKFQYHGSLQANLLDLDEWSSTGKQMPVDATGAGPRKTVMPLSRSLIDFK
jgi:murein DD-endopeptidase MepM/ murein hydrolase activator NlpD